MFLRSFNKDVEQAREHLDQLADGKDDETVVKNPLTDGAED